MRSGVFVVAVLDRAIAGADAVEMRVVSGDLGEVWISGTT